MPITQISETEVDTGTSTDFALYPEYSPRWRIPEASPRACTLRPLRSGESRRARVQRWIGAQDLRSQDRRRYANRFGPKTSRAWLQGKVPVSQIRRDPSNSDYINLDTGGVLSLIDMTRKSPGGMTKPPSSTKETVRIPRICIPGGGFSLATTQITNNCGSSKPVKRVGPT